MMKRLLIGTIYIGTAVLAFFLGVHFTMRVVEQKTLPSLTETMEYNSSIYNASSYAQILLALRQGDVPRTLNRLEHMTDVSILMASANTNALVQAFPDGPWKELQQDRLAHPRDTSAEREARINAFLDNIIEEKPQQAGPGYPPQGVGSPDP